MEQQKRVLFGTMPDGTAAEAVTLKRGKLSCRILTYGGGGPVPGRPRPGRKSGGRGAGL